MAHSPVSRRSMLALAALAGTAGCTNRPTVATRATARSASAQATPDEHLQAALQAELAVLQLLEDQLAAPRKDLAAPQLALLTGLRRAHGAHAELLAKPDPLGAPAGAASPAASPSSTATPMPWKTLSQRLVALEDAAARTHHTGTRAATDPVMALLHASLATFAALQHTPSPVIEGSAAPAHVEVGERPVALGVLLSRVRALVEGLEIGLGQLPSTSDQVSHGRERMRTVMALRDRVEADMRREGSPVPPMELGYAMPGGFASPAAVLKTWAALESAVTEAWARTTAASTGAERSASLEALVAQARVARQSGSPTNWWPGWV